MHTPVTNNPLCHNALISYTLDRFNVLWLAILLCEKDTFSWFWIYKRYFSCNSAELCRISPLLYLRDERYGSHSMWMLSWIDHTLPSSKPLLWHMHFFSADWAKVGLLVFRFLHFCISRTSDLKRPLWTHSISRIKTKQVWHHNLSFTKYTLQLKYRVKMYGKIFESTKAF